MGRSIPLFTAIALLKIWNYKGKFSKKYFNIRELLEDLIEIRHKIVHKAHIDVSLADEEVKKYGKAVEIASRLLVDAFKAKGVRIDIDKFVIGHTRFGIF